MISAHGALEGAILTTLWKLEEKGFVLNTVKDVFDNMDNEKRAYTTIKTVMDRLCAKKILLRQKKGKRYFYKTAFSNREIIIHSLNDISKKYCCGNLSRLFEILDTMQETRLSAGA